MNFSKLLPRFFKVVLCIYRPLPNKTKMKFDQDVNACWSFFFELKVLNESKYSMPWIGCAFGNVLSWYGMIHEGKIEVSFQIRFFWTIVTPKPKKTYNCTWCLQHLHAQRRAGTFSPFKFGLHLSRGFFSDYIYSCLWKTCLPKIWPRKVSSIMTSYRIILL